MQITNPPSPFSMYQKLMPAAPTKSLSDRAYYLGKGCINLAIATLFTVYTFQSYKENLCLEARAFPNQFPYFEFADIYSNCDNLSGQEDFKIPVSTLSMISTGLTAANFTAAALNNFGSAVF